LGGVPPEGWSGEPLPGGGELGSILLSSALRKQKTTAY
jgi:hypothetical protein